MSLGSHETQFLFWKQKITIMVNFVVRYKIFILYSKYFLDIGVINWAGEHATTFDLSIKQYVFCSSSQHLRFSIYAACATFVCCGTA